LALIIGDHLHLNQQRGLRTVANRRSVQIADADAAPGQFFGDEDLVRIAASEPVRGDATHLFEEAGFGGIAKCIQPGRSKRVPE
jgi:hypothetical protein